MLKEIIKRDGRIEKFDAGKLNHWAIWSTQGIEDRVDWSSAVLDAVSNLGERCTSQELQLRLVDVLVSRKSWPYGRMAGTLYVAHLRKLMYGEKMPTVRELFELNHSRGLMRSFESFTDEEWAQVEEIINHDLDFTMQHFQIKQFVNKYSIQNKKLRQSYEIPQFTMMRKAMALSLTEPVGQRMHRIRSRYTNFSRERVNSPSPNYMNLGTDLNGYASCCLHVSGDTRQSIAAGHHIDEVMTYMSAGIGSRLNSRSVGDAVRGGSILHQGKIPYFAADGKIVKSSLQAGRGGAKTCYVDFFDPEARTVIGLQDPRATQDLRNRDLHFAMQGNQFFAEKVRKNEDIFTFNVFTAPDLNRAFFSGDQQNFSDIYHRYEADTKFKKNYVNARSLLVAAGTQAFQTGTVYDALMDEINRHTPFLEPIYSSNLCVSADTLLLTENGEFPIQSLAGQTVAVWNGHCWSKSPVVKTGSGQTLMRVLMRHVGDHKLVKLDATHYHKWYIANPHEEVAERRTHELQVGDMVENFMLPDGSVHSLVIDTIIELAGVHDTYCVGEPDVHKAVFNGVLTGQCLEITSPTKPYTDVRFLYDESDHGQGEVAVCSLAAINVAVEMTDEEYASAAYDSLDMIDRCIDMSEFELAHVRFTSRHRRNAGVGILGLATALARKGLSYSTLEGRNEIHRIAERHAYFVIRASLRLGQERGNAPWIGKTKWPQGWLPIDTYKRTVDELVTVGLQYNWEELRHEIIANGGLRNSSLIAHMPTDTSSKASGAPNGVYPIRDLAGLKTDGSAAIDWLATDGDILGDRYDIAWKTDPLRLIEAYAVIQKFTDQAISADSYADRRTSPDIPVSRIVNTYLHRVKYGVKTAYYQNSLTSDETGKPVELKTEEACGGGGCKL